MIGRLVKYLVVLAALACVGLAIFAYVGDLAPAPSPGRLTVTLHAD